MPGAIWLKEAQACFVGTTPEGVNPVIQAGTSVIGLPASSFHLVTFPYVFVNGIVSVVGCSGDGNTPSRFIIPAVYSLSGCSFRVTGNNDVGLAGNGSRINWFALGW